MFNSNINTLRFDGRYYILVYYVNNDKRTSEVMTIKAVIKLIKDNKLNDIVFDPSINDRNKNEIIKGLK